MADSERKLQVPLDWRYIWRPLGCGLKSDVAVEKHLSSNMESEVVCLAAIRRRGRTKCCSWWRHQRYCFINSPSTSHIQWAAHWLNTETTHVKPACSTSLIKQTYRSQEPRHKKQNAHIRPESRKRKENKLGSDNQACGEWNIKRGYFWQEQRTCEHLREGEVPDMESHTREGSLIDQRKLTLRRHF